jgi:hypothetical protein
MPKLSDTFKKVHNQSTLFVPSIDDPQLARGWLLVSFLDLLDAGRERYGRRPIGATHSNDAHV